MNPTIDELLKKEVFLKTTAANGRYVIYDRQWLLNHLEEEFELLKNVKQTTATPFTKEDFEQWMKMNDSLKEE